MNTRKKSCMTALISTIILIVIDQLTKALAVSKLKAQASISIIKNVFILEYLENRGAAWGMLTGARAFFVILAVVITVVVVYFYIKLPDDKKYRYLKIVMVLMVSGAIGNMIDRAVNGYVVDFFSFILINFPVFNVADIYVTCGAFLFAILLIFYYKDEDFAFLNRSKEK